MIGFVGRGGLPFAAGFPAELSLPLKARGNRQFFENLKSSVVSSDIGAANAILRAAGLDSIAEWLRQRQSRPAVDAVTETLGFGSEFSCKPGSRADLITESFLHGMRP